MFYHPLNGSRLMHVKAITSVHSRSKLDVQWQVALPVHEHCSVQPEPPVNRTAPSMLHSRWDEGNAMMQFASDGASGTMDELFVTLII